MQQEVLGMSLPIPSLSVMVGITWEGTKHLTALGSFSLVGKYSVCFKVL